MNYLITLPPKIKAQLEKSALTIMRTAPDDEQRFMVYVEGGLKAFGDTPEEALNELEKLLT